METSLKILICKYVFVLFLILTIGCANEEQDWQNTQASGTVSAYESFIANHPNSQFSQKALEKIWQLTKERKTITDLEMFISNHSNSPFSQKALEEVWRLTKEKNTISAYEYFLNNHSSSSYSSLAKNNIKSIWTSLVPPKPRFELRSNMTVNLDWAEVAGAQEYVVYWSSSQNFRKSKANSETTQSTSFNSKLRDGEYGAKLPMYYRITALRDSIESKLSEACLAKLFPNKDGKFCEICGDKSIGYCHLRVIYVCEQHNTFTSDDGTGWQCP